MMQLQVEDIMLCQNELEALGTAHWGEVSRAEPGVSYGLNWGAYEQLSAMDLLIFVTARESGLLAGYVIWILYPDMHRRLGGAQMITACDDAHYLKPELRHGRNVLRLFEFAEEALRAWARKRELKKIRVGVHTKHHLPQERFFRFLGYAPDDISMTKYLEISQ